MELLKALRGILTLRREQPRRDRRMVPDYAWFLASFYGVSPEASENHKPTGAA